MATAIFIGGCADPLERPMADEAAEKFKRGIRGEGQLGPIDRSDDQYIRQTYP